jgi:hypothetical protein
MSVKNLFFGKPKVAVAEPAQDPNLNLPMHQILRHGRDLTVSPELAKRILQECAYERQRPVSQSHVDTLAAEIRRGGLTPRTELHFCAIGERLYCVNGQHRIHAVVKADRPYLFHIKVSEVDTYEQVGVIYANEDHGKGRTVGDAVRTSGFDERHGLSDRQVRDLLAATLLIKVGFQRPRLSQHAPVIKSWSGRFRIAANWVTEARKYFGILERANGLYSRQLRRAPNMAVALITLRYQPEKATEFWMRVADDDGLRQGDPAKALLRALAESVGKSYAPTTQIRFPAAAWNAFYNNKRLSRFHIDLDEPLVIAGTPVGKEAAGE